MLVAQLSFRQLACAFEAHLSIHGRNLGLQRIAMQLDGQHFLRERALCLQIRDFEFEKILRRQKWSASCVRRDAGVQQRR
jgi:hypothetical protein